MKKTLQFLDNLLVYSPIIKQLFNSTKSAISALRGSWHTISDQSVNVENSITFFNELRKHKVKVDAHFFNDGRHGLSIINKETSFTDQDVNSYLAENKHLKIWTELLSSWLENLE